MPVMGCQARPPRRTGSRVPLAHVADQARNGRICGNEGQRRVEQALEVGLDERRGLHRGDHLGAVDGGAVGG